jgi:hypothetical protein
MVGQLTAAANRTLASRAAVEADQKRMLPPVGMQRPLAPRLARLQIDDRHVYARDQITERDRDKTI